MRVTSSSLARADPVPTRENGARMDVTSGDWREWAHGGCLGGGSRGRTRPRGEMLRGGAGSLRAGGIRMGQPGWRTASHQQECWRAPGELKHLSTLRKREDSLSSGERTGRSPNRCGGTACRRCQIGVVRDGWRGRQSLRVDRLLSRRPLERVTGAGESPVGNGRSIDVIHLRE